MSTPPFLAAAGATELCRDSASRYPQVPDCWSVHAPFVGLLLEQTRPKVVLDFGAADGIPGAILREAVARYGAGKQCRTIDLRLNGDQEAVNSFADGAIELLHIDASDPAQLPVLDFSFWRTKLSSNATVAGAADTGALCGARFNGDACADLLG